MWTAAEHNVKVKWSRYTQSPWWTRAGAALLCLFLGMLFKLQYTLCCERGMVKNMVNQRDQAHLNSFIDKLIRNRIDSLWGSKNGRFDKYLQLWFANRWWKEKHNLFGFRFIVIFITNRAAFFVKKFFLFK